MYSTVNFKSKMCKYICLPSVALVAYIKDEKGTRVLSTRGSSLAAHNCAVVADYVSGLSSTIGPYGGVVGMP